MATGFLHPVEPQAPLPSEYDADYTNCIADPAHSTNCLTVALWAQFTEPMVGKVGAKRLEGNARSYRNRGMEEKVIGNTEVSRGGTGALQAVERGKGVK